MRAQSYQSQTLAAVLITHNHAATLEAALESLRWVDELIVMDLGSTDATLQIARRFTPHVHFHPSRNPVILRRDALQYTQSDWVLLVEPDESVEEMLRHEIQGLLVNMPRELIGFTIARKERFYHLPLQWNQAIQPEKALRLLKKGAWRIAESWHADPSSLRPAEETNKHIRALTYGLETQPIQSSELLWQTLQIRSQLRCLRLLDKHGCPHSLPPLWQLYWVGKKTFLQALFLKGYFFQGVPGLMVAICTMLEIVWTECRLALMAQRSMNIR